MTPFWMHNLQIKDGKPIAEKRKRNRPKERRKQPKLAPCDEVQNCRLNPPKLPGPNAPSFEYKEVDRFWLDALATAWAENAQIVSRGPTLDAWHDDEGSSTELSEEDNFTEKEAGSKRPVVPSAVYSSLIGEIRKLCQSLNVPVSKMKRFKLLRLLGVGRTARIVLSRRKASSLVALKLFSFKDLLNDPLVLDHFETELQVLSSVDHPFIVKLYRVAISNDAVALVLQHVPGGCLLGHLAKRIGKLSEEWTRFYVAEIATALQHLHSKGFLYRDLRLEHLVLDENGHVILIDFGLATRDAIAPPAADARLPSFSPEMLSSSPCCSSSSDWFALGVVAFELLFLKTPFMTPAMMKQAVESLDKASVLSAGSWTAVQGRLLALGRPPMEAESLFQRGPLHEQLAEQICSANPLVPPPGRVSRPMLSFLAALLCKAPQRRLGVSGLPQFARHPVFETVRWNWGGVEAKSLLPPFKPVIAPLEEDADRSVVNRSPALQMNPPAPVEKPVAVTAAPKGSAELLQKLAAMSGEFGRGRRKTDDCIDSRLTRVADVHRVVTRLEQETGMEARRIERDLQESPTWEVALVPLQKGRRKRRKKRSARAILATSPLAVRKNRTRLPSIVSMH